MPEEKPDVRAYLAAERTLLAWIRTGLALMGFGFVVARFGLLLRELAMPPRDIHVSAWFGTALVLLGVAVNSFSVIDYLRIARRLDRGQPSVPVRSMLGIALSWALSTIGLAMAAYLLASK